MRRSALIVVSLKLRGIESLLISHYRFEGFDEGSRWRCFASAYLSCPSSQTYPIAILGQKKRVLSAESSNRSKSCDNNPQLAGFDRYGVV
jgi:hypothetical protein